jgi:hypothetical protein
MPSQDLQALGDVAGVVNRGLAAHAIQRLPQASFKQLSLQAAAAATAGAADEEQQGTEADVRGDTPAQHLAVASLERCTICMDDFVDEGERHGGGAQPIRGAAYPMSSLTAGRWCV